MLLVMVERIFYLVANIRGFTSSSSCTSRVILGEWSYLFHISLSHSLLTTNFCCIHVSRRINVFIENIKFVKFVKLETLVYKSILKILDTFTTL